MIRAVVLALVLCNQATTCAAQCDSDFGAADVCCDQKAVIAAKEPGRKAEKPCPEGTPTCVGFLFGQAFGTCQAAAVESKTSDESGTDTQTQAVGTEGTDASKGNVQTDGKPKSEAERKADWCRRNYVSAKECDKWVADQLSRKAARKADRDPAVLKKEDEERDREDAERDRKEAERDAKRDEEDKKRDEAERKKDDHSADGSNAATISPLTLSVLSLAAEDADADAWQKDLSADQRAALQHELAHLHHKSVKEQEIASQDGPGASEIMRQEYVQKASLTIAKFKQKANAAREAKANAPPADAKANSQPGHATANSPPVDAKASNDADKNPSGTPTETLSLSTVGHLTEKIPLGSIAVPVAFGLFAYFALSALLPRRSQQSAALLKHASPV